MSESAARWLDRLGYGDSPVHRLEARAKIAATAVFVVCVASFPKYEVVALVPFLAFPAVLVAAARLSPRPILTLLVAASPFALLVGVWNPLLDRAPRPFFAGLVAAGGWLSFTSILLRFVLCTGAALALAATTPLPALLRALRQLGVPAAFVTQLQLLYRYLFLLAEEARRSSQARALREPLRRLPRLSTARRMLASLLWRTWERGERVYVCMKVRGFDGSLPMLDPSPLRARDALYAASVSVACVAARVLPLAGWLESLLGAGGVRS